MQVNVFLAREQRGPRSKLLVLTVASEAEIPKNLSKYWRFYGTIDSQSALFDGVAVELHLQARGFAIVEA
jgi:hypothetical protein